VVDFVFDISKNIYIRKGKLRRTKSLNDIPKECIYDSTRIKKDNMREDILKSIEKFNEIIDSKIYKKRIIDS
jgi:hypothetical protein